jgi:5'-methylthioadenosine phosphorylase
VVIPTQIYDNTKGRDYSFFGDGLVAHLGIAEPFCPHLRQLLAEAVSGSGGTVHMGGTFIVIEGPRFSTRGESNIYRSWGVDIIGMTAVHNLMANAALSKRTIAKLVPQLADERPCDCGDALSSAFITQRDLIPAEKVEQLGPITAKYLG